MLVPKSSEGLNQGSPSVRNANLSLRPSRVVVERRFRLKISFLPAARPDSDSACLLILLIVLPTPPYAFLCAALFEPFGLLKAHRQWLAASPQGGKESALGRAAHQGREIAMTSIAPGPSSYFGAPADGHRRELVALQHLPRTQRHAERPQKQALHGVTKPSAFLA